jgi:hypothetical protein
MKTILSLHGLGQRSAVLALLLCVLLAGCGSGRGQVSGTVRCGGKPLPFGTIQFLGPDGIPRAGQIQPDGTFSVEVPVGEAKVMVCCVSGIDLKRPDKPSATSASRAAPPAVAPRARSLIPARYADWNASGLTVQVANGKMTQDFALSWP